MSKVHPEKVDRINRFGQTADLPLFEQPNLKENKKYPNWICNGTSVKAEVWSQIKNTEKIAKDCWTVLKAIINAGGSATDHEIKQITGLELHIVSARRNTLIQIGYVKSSPGKKKMGPHGKLNTLWEIDFEVLRKRTAIKQ